MSKSEISVLKVTRLRGDRPLKAYVDVQIGSWVINDWRIIDRPGKAIEVNYPSVSYSDSQGTIRYRSLLSIPMELRQRVEVAILSMWEKEKDSGTAKQ